MNKKHKDIFQQFSTKLWEQLLEQSLPYTTNIQNRPLFSPQFVPLLIPQQEDIEVVLDFPNYNIDPENKDIHSFYIQPSVRIIFHTWAQFFDENIQNPSDIDDTITINVSGS